MSERLGPSCSLKLKMIPEGSKCAETRRFPVAYSEWYEISKYCIENKIYLMLTICIDRDGKLEHFPTEKEWRDIIEDSVIKLLDLGGNKNNCEIDIVNEPTKYCTKEQYGWLLDIAYDQARGRLDIGAGCDEPINAQAIGLIPYILENHKNSFEILIIHIQGSCDSKEKTEKFVKQYYEWAKAYGKRLNCNESNLKDVSTDSGWRLHRDQIDIAEKYGVENCPMVFCNLDPDIFPDEVLEYFKSLSFMVNGVPRSEKNWNEYKKLMKEKAPVPNIKEEKKIARDGMIIKTIGFKETDMKSGYPVLLANELLYKNNFLNFSDVGYSYTEQTKQATIDFINHIRDIYPTDPVKQKLKSDGRIGRQTFRYLIEELPEKEEREKYFNALEIMTSPYNLEGDT